MVVRAQKSIPIARCTLKLCKNVYLVSCLKQPKLLTIIRKKWTLTRKVLKTMRDNFATAEYVEKAVEEAVEKAVEEAVESTEEENKERNGS